MLIHELLEPFNPKFIRYGFAYGSAVLHQSGYSSNDVKSGMLDMMLVIKSGSIAEFHRHNIESNPSHYSSLVSSKFGQRHLLDALQNSGAGVYFNTDVEINGRRAKYGIVEEGRFISDLENWDTLYLAGRMQKPVVDLADQDKNVTEARRKNLTFALHCALLMLPQNFSTFDLLESIVGISYLGDIRRGLAENPMKVKNIVEGQQEQLWKLYEPLLESVGFGEYVHETGAGSGNWEQDDRGEVKYVRSVCLPSSIRQRLKYPKDFRLRPEHLKSAISSIICWPSVVQSAKGILTADPSVSFKYLLAKMNKRFS